MEDDYSVINGLQYKTKFKRVKTMEGNLNILKKILEKVTSSYS
jgi:hypothetical protein